MGHPRPEAQCVCNHTFRQHQTARGYCGYCDCEAFVLAEQQPEPKPAPVVLKQEVPQVTEEDHMVNVALGHLTPYYRDNLLSLLLAFPEANSGDWYHELLNGLETLEADVTSAIARPKQLRAAVSEEADKLKQEIVRLHQEGVPGVMHEVDKGFHDLVVQERDAERYRVNMLREEVKEKEAKIREMALDGLSSEGQWIEEVGELNKKNTELRDLLKRIYELPNLNLGDDDLVCELDAEVYGEESGTGSDSVEHVEDELSGGEEQS